MTVIGYQISLVQVSYPCCVPSQLLVKINSILAKPRTDLHASFPTAGPTGTVLNHSGFPKDHTAPDKVGKQRVNATTPFQLCSF